MGSEGREGQAKMIRHGRARKVLRDFSKEKLSVGFVLCRKCKSQTVLLNPFGPREVDECILCKNLPSKNTPEACPES